MEGENCFGRWAPSFEEGSHEFKSECFYIHLLVGKHLFLELAYHTFLLLYMELSLQTPKSDKSLIFV